MMPDRKVIYDSEDEDAGFSPLNSPSRGDATNADVASRGEDINTMGQPQQELDISETLSTDPNFFRHVYDVQQNVETEVIPDSTRDGNGDMGSSDMQKSSSRHAKHNSSSLTDPSSKSARNGISRVDRVDFANFTQVTTPRGDAPGFPKDIYDFPSSNEEGEAAETTVSKAKTRAIETFRKRKRGDIATPVETPVSSSPAHPSSQHGDLMPTHPHGTGEAPQPTSKKRKSGTQQSLAQIPEDVDLLVIPRTADMNESPAKIRADNEDLGDIVTDTFKDGQGLNEYPPASFFIAPPSRLTASQKQEYVRISGSSDHEKEEKHEPSFSLLQAQAQHQQIHSSEATIAYTTPSRYCPTPRFLDLQETGDRDSSSTTASTRKRADITRTDASLPHSSPDELGSHSPNQTLSKARRREGAEDNGNRGQDDFWDFDEIGSHREQYVPRPNRKRAGINPNEDLEGPATADDSGSARKKRLNTRQRADVAQEDLWDSDRIGTHRETYKPRPSRRRSRAVVQEDAESELEQSMPDTCPPRQASSGLMEGAEAVLNLSGQQAAQDEVEGVEGIDPDYLAALPEDLRHEVIRDHLARNAQASRTRGRGRPSQPLSAFVAPPEETSQPKKRGRTREPLIGEEPAVAQDADMQEAPASIAPAKRKRGRPRKSNPGQPAPAAVAAADEDISFAYGVEDLPQVADDPTAEGLSSDEPAHEAPVPVKVPSKRGRKKKVVQEPPTTPEEPTEPVADDSLPSEPVQPSFKIAKAPPKRGRKKKVLEKPSAADEDEPEEEGNNTQDPGTQAGTPAELPFHGPGDRVKEEADVSRMPLQDISNTSPSKEKEVTPEAKAKETPRSTSSTNGQGQGKVPLRVGLSKRSRIAPLLKIIRK